MVLLIKSSAALISLEACSTLRAENSVVLTATGIIKTAITSNQLTLERIFKAAPSARSLPRSAALLRGFDTSWNSDNSALDHAARAPFASPSGFDHPGPTAWLGRVRRRSLRAQTVVPWWRHRP